MLERRALIEKMVEFEKRHFFQSSFRLLEEKWRKSCWPNLVKTEDKLINTCPANFLAFILSFLKNLILFYYYFFKHSNKHFLNIFQNI
ncbi:hypothetical protein Glove_84g21 [Diversispora epigaea]|uniref:Uncharacterized protein n=1 Tax=Diversispora epigaea TaxID=1348612 RepID=A0A397JB25_9GLOM|nr:hypothetical protein Glove_84g21 [Diversispora epigaea]